MATGVERFPQWPNAYALPDPEYGPPQPCDPDLHQRLTTDLLFHHLLQSHMLKDKARHISTSGLLCHHVSCLLGLWQGVAVRAQCVRALLLFLLWSNSGTSGTFLECLQQHVRKARPDDIYECCQVIIFFAAPPCHWSMLVCR